MMKYKILCHHDDWLPREGGSIKIWIEDVDGQSLWPPGEPYLLQPRAMRNLPDVLLGFWASSLTGISNLGKTILVSIVGVTNLSATTGGLLGMLWICPLTYQQHCKMDSGLVLVLIGQWRTNSGYWRSP